MHIQKNMIELNEGFKCANCKRTVGPHEGGSCRNHCPYCLFSLHVDLNVPGDRANECKGLMAPTGAELNKKKGPRIIHVCRVCGHRSFNRCAPDDDWEQICRVSRIPQ